MSVQSLAHWLARRAENVAATLLAVMFLAFIVQIVFRYLFNFPIGWTSELSTVTWLWLVLWGAALVVPESEEIRFDLVYGLVGPGMRRLFVLMMAVAVVGLYGISLPAVVDYVTFMRVQKTAYLDIRFDWLFSVYVLFAVASIARYLWLGWRALFATAAPPPPDPSKTGSGI